MASLMYHVSEQLACGKCEEIDCLNGASQTSQGNLRVSAPMYNECDAKYQNMVTQTL